MEHVFRFYYENNIVCVLEHALSFYYENNLVGTLHELDLSILVEPPEDLRARELDAANVGAVKLELQTKGKLGAKLEIICAAPPVSFRFIVKTIWMF